MYMNMKILSRRKQTFMQCTNQLRQFGINQTVLILKLTAVAILAITVSNADLTLSE